MCSFYSFKNVQAQYHNENYALLSDRIMFLSPTQEDAVALVAPQGRVEFRNVNFSYSPEKNILDDVSFVVEPGQTLAIVSI